MRLIELEITNIRGIRHLLLSPQEKNFTVWGPNGSGKSAVVDAVDFLLRGKITRLTGKGTRDLSLTKHGPHIDCKPPEAMVRAVISISGKDGTIEISRCMDEPNKLICAVEDRPFLEPIFTLADRGHHVLTRREILRYITSEGGSRASDIQELLNISEIERIRSTLVTVQNAAKNDLRNARQALIIANAAVSARLGITSIEVALEKVNTYRAVFGKSPIAELTSSQIKKDLSLPAAAAGRPGINTTLIQMDLENLGKAFDPSHQAGIREKDIKLRELLSELRKDPQKLRALSLRDLINLGIELIDGSGACPLCETAWIDGKLRIFLESRLTTAAVVEQTTTEIGELAQSISIPVASMQASLQRVMPITAQMDLKDAVIIFKNWESDLQAIQEEFNSSLLKYPTIGIDPEKVARLVAPDQLVTVLDEVQAAIKEKYPDTTPEQTAWDILNKLEEDLKILDSAEQDYRRNDLFAKRASTLLNHFLAARDAVLGTLYDAIKDRFVELYKLIHEEDEKGFTASLKPAGAALDFEVDFYGRGVHPPHALHSEGHQDSMGLCLYLALAERLTGGLLDLIILDDVVMSVDSDHRRQVCKLFANAFPNRQFLITTHDKVWSSQLVTEGVVKKKNRIEFYNWNVDLGPQVNSDADLWVRIASDLDKNDVPAASAALRRGSEEYFSLVCEAFQAQVKYKSSGRWELGELLGAAKAQYKNLILKAKDSAISWGSNPLVRDLANIDKKAGEIFQRIQNEQWAVNENVHYNNWANFSKEDFSPVVQAFHDLFGLFQCPDCGAILSIASTGTEPANLRCYCGKVNWNLVMNKNPRKKEEASHAQAD